MIQSNRIFKKRIRIVGIGSITYDLKLVLVSIYIYIINKLNTSRKIRLYFDNIVQVSDERMTLNELHERRRQIAIFVGQLYSDGVLVSGRGQKLRHAPCFASQLGVSVVDHRPARKIYKVFICTCRKHVTCL